MSLQAAAFYAGWHAALDVARAMLDEDNPDPEAGRAALHRARFEGIVSAEEPDRARTLDTAGAAVVELLDAAAADSSGAVELVARRLVVDDLDVAAETLTMLALLAHQWRTDVDLVSRPPVTPRWALGWVEGPTTR